MATSWEMVAPTETAIELIEAYAANNTPVALWGAPGIGKSEIVGQFVEKMRQTNPDYGFVNVHALLKNPVDLLGLPVPDMETRTTVWLRPSDLPIVGNDSFPKFGALFVDEIDKIPSAAMRALCLQLVLNRCVGEHKIKEGWVIFAAGNRQIDKTESQKLGTALDNRLAHITIVAEIGAFVKHALGIAKQRNDATFTRNVAYMCAFLRAKPWYLHAMPGGELPREAGLMRNAAGQEVPIKLDQNRRAFPTPRQWLREVSKYLEFHPKIRTYLIGGVIGHDIAAEFAGFLLNVDKIATPSEIEFDSTTCKVPDVGEMAARFYATGMLCGMVNRKNIQAVMTYAQRLGSEFYTLIGLDIGASKPHLCDSAAYVAWCVETGNDAQEAA